MVRSTSNPNTRDAEAEGPAVPDKFKPLSKTPSKKINKINGQRTKGRYSVHSLIALTGLREKIVNRCSRQKAPP